MYLLILCCFARAFSSCYKWGLLFPVAHRLLIVVLSLVAEHGLQAPRLSSCDAGALLLPGMWDFLDQESNLCPLHWQAHSYPLKLSQAAAMLLHCPAVAVHPQQHLQEPSPPPRGSGATSGGDSTEHPGNRAQPAGSRPPPLEQPPEGAPSDSQGTPPRVRGLKEAISSGAMPGDSGSASATAGLGPQSCPGASVSSHRPSALGCSVPPCAPGRGSLPGCPGSAWQPAQPPGTWLQRREPDNSGEGWGKWGR